MMQASGRGAAGAILIDRSQTAPLSLINGDGLQRIIARGRVGYFFGAGVSETTGTNLGNERIASCICDGVTPLSRISCHKLFVSGLLLGEVVGFEVVLSISGMTTAVLSARVRAVSADPAVAAVPVRSGATLRPPDSPPRRLSPRPVARWRSRSYPSVRDKPAPPGFPAALVPAPDRPRSPGD